MKKLCLVVLFVLLLVSGLIQANTITSSIEVEALAKKHAS
ncbi:MAG: hypothetical protein PWQ85_599 [Geotoga sp.]|jgi:hypothetical protein|nr:hypothetical protein [Geotoga sp.]